MEPSKPPQGLSADILNAAPLRDPLPALWESPTARVMATAGDWATDNGLLVDQPEDEEFEDPCR